ncbi:MAG: hypothetical protein ACK40G_00890 [Cytophagaceae bacterium]
MFKKLLDQFTGNKLSLPGDIPYYFTFTFTSNASNFQNGVNIIKTLELNKEKVIYKEIVKEASLNTASKDWKILKNHTLERELTEEQLVHFYKFLKEINYTRIGSPVVHNEYEGKPVFSWSFSSDLSFQKKKDSEMVYFQTMDTSDYELEGKNKFNHDRLVHYMENIAGGMKQN